MFRKAEGQHARAFQADGRAIDEKIRLYARVGAALISAREAKRDAFDAIAAGLPRDRFRETGTETESLARSRSSTPTRCWVSIMLASDAGLQPSLPPSPSKASWLSHLCYVPSRATRHEQYIRAQPAISARHALLHET
jgi:hypothetical protein